LADWKMLYKTVWINSGKFTGISRMNARVRGSGKTFINLYLQI